jgi:1,4-alpha-glucan branching enzyme/maltooligosyltrehalose trehalohydrolase
MGERLAQLVDGPALQLVTAMQLLNPAPPLIFMGEEFGATTPFLYFSDWQGELRQAVTEGRRKEFAQFPQFADAALRARIPDPCDEATFVSSKLDWTAAAQTAGRHWRAYYGELLALRREWFTPYLSRLQTGLHTAERLSERVLHVRWAIDGRVWLEMLVNLSPEPVILADLAPLGPMELAFFSVGEVSDRGLGAWSGCWWIERP